jgi:pimeloyl-ACP methyl ester carboxylesterase
MKNLPVVILAAALMAGAAGCTQVNYTHMNRYEEGLVVCLSGAGGMMGETERLREGLNAAGVARAIEVFDWSAGGVLQDQTAVEANRRKAGRLARRIEDYKRSHGGRPVHLVGVSAGTGLVVWALEDLSEGCEATGAVLISSSLDTKYDLTKALTKVSDGLYSFNSVADTVLSLGVTWAGTVDRGGGIAGGLVGFSPPDGASDQTKALYKAKLREISWWPGDVVLGHIGDHLGATNPAYVKAKIAPIVLGRQPGQPSPAEKPASEKTPDQAVKHKEAVTPEYAERLEAKRKADEARKAAAEKAAKDLAEKKKGGKKPQPKKPAKPRPKKPDPLKEAVRGDDVQRFFDWHVGRRASSSEETRSSDADRFFREPRRLP